MEQVIISEYLDAKLKDMVADMYYNNNFRFWENSESYVQRIYDYIYTIPTQTLKLCKNPKYGKYYVKYDNAKSKMSYYITFNKFENDYFIKDIISPKTKEYLAIRGLK